MSSNAEHSYSNSQSQVKENEDKSFINAHKIVNNRSRLSVSERQIICKEKKVAEETSLRKSSLRSTRSNEFLSPLIEVIVESQVDISTVTMVSHNVLKKENKSLKMEKKQQNRKMKNVLRQNTQLKDENKSLAKEVKLLKSIINGKEERISCQNEIIDAERSKNDRLKSSLSKERRSRVINRGLANENRKLKVNMTEIISNLRKHQHMNDELIQLKEESEKRKAALEKTITIKNKCINELKNNMNVINESGDAALARRDRVIDRLSTELKEMKGAYKEISKNMKLLQKTNNRNKEKLIRTKE